jgi:hypothetical protein
LGADGGLLGAEGGLFGAEGGLFGAEGGLLGAEGGTPGPGGGEVPPVVAAARSARVTNGRGGGTIFFTSSKELPVLGLDTLSAAVGLVVPPFPWASEPTAPMLTTCSRAVAASGFRPCLGLAFAPFGPESAGPDLTDRRGGRVAIGFGLLVIGFHAGLNHTSPCPQSR